MKNLKNAIEAAGEVLQKNETTLSRVWKHVNDKKIPVATITAFRKNPNDIVTPDKDGEIHPTPEQAKQIAKINLEQNIKLAKEVKAAGYGYFFVDGYTIETQDDGSKHKVKEKTIFVVGKENDKSKLKFLLKQWVKKYKQDSMLLKPEGETTAILIDKKGSEINIGSFNPNKIGDFYTKLLGRGERTFVFESASEFIEGD